MPHREPRRMTGRASEAQWGLEASSQLMGAPWWAQRKGTICLEDLVPLLCLLFRGHAVSVRKDAN